MAEITPFLLKLLLVTVFYHSNRMELKMPYVQEYENSLGYMARLYFKKTKNISGSS